MEGLGHTFAVKLASRQVVLRGQFKAMGKEPFDQRSSLGWPLICADTSAQAEVYYFPPESRTY